MTTRTLVASSLLLSSLLGCSFAARSPDDYRDATAAVLATKNEEIKGCYDGVVHATPGASGKVTIKFIVEPDKGSFSKVTVDNANTTAPEAVQACVTKAIANLAITPGDVRQGDATFVYEFSAPPPPPPPPPAPAAAAALPPGTAAIK